MASRLRYAVVGTGGRSSMFINALIGDYRDAGELVALCDVNPGRMAFYNQHVQGKGVGPLPQYHPDDFEKMLDENRIDRVIVTTKDCFHDEFLVRAMVAGRDCVTEKPMTTDEVKCQRILDTMAKTGRKITVTFNYRYGPSRSKVKELIQQGTIGDVKSVHFEWLLDTTHGADYFRRWHRDRKNSGTLLVHKATHHFDLVNWWIGSSPVWVYARGGLGFYRPDNKEYPWRGKRCRTCKHIGECKFALRGQPGGSLDRMYYQNEQHDGYYRDVCVFAPGITIFDTMSVVAEYASGASLSYSLNAFMPKEGFTVAFNGTKGRIELDELEASYINAHDGKIVHATPKSGVKITVFPHFTPAYTVEPQKAVGGHGGGDVLLLSDVFRGPGNDPLKRAANAIDGANSILLGIAARKSIDSGKPVNASKLIRIPRKLQRAKA